MISYFRVYLLFLIPSYIALSLGFFYSYKQNTHRTEKDFIEKYKSISESYAYQAAQFDHSYEELMKTALIGIRNEIKTSEISSKALKEIARKYNVTHLFIINSSGKFTKSTNEDPSEIPNLFSFSNEYKNLIQNKKVTYLATPVIIPFPEKEPHKFMTIWANGFFIEIGLKIKEIAKTIEAIVAQDSNIFKVDLLIGNTAYTIKEQTENWTDILKIQKNITVSNVNFTQAETATKHSYKMDFYITRRELLADLDSIRNTYFFNFILTLSLITLLIYVATSFLRSKVKTITGQVVGLVEQKDFTKNLTNLSTNKDFNNLIKAINELLSNYRASTQKAIKYEKELLYKNMATQVAHDIRSPLEVLRSLNNEMKHFPDSTRRRIQLSINRIEEIAFNLLKKHKENTGILPENRSEDLLAVINSTITEKNIEYRNYENLEIIDNLDSTCFGLHSKINRASLKSVLSNLINNAVEAYNGARGVVEIDLTQDSDNCIIKITDNGPGISESISPKLFTKGFTTKKNGNGLGLYNAKQDLESVGGTLTYFTEVRKGTTFTITLPKSEAPKTFIDAIHAYKYERIIVLDDDPAFHEVWAKRLEGLEGKIEHLYSVKEMLSKYQALHPKILLLSDFELMDKDYDGIDVILKLNHAANSVLVTARSEELAIQERCLKNDIKLLPKSLVNYIKVFKELSESSHAQLEPASNVGDSAVGSAGEKYGIYIQGGQARSDAAVFPRESKLDQVEGSQGGAGEAYKKYGAEGDSRSDDAQIGSNLIILIDDDKLVHINWRMYCEKNGFTFHGFKSIAEFLNVAQTFDKSTRIYIDSNLGDGIKGEIESEKIFLLGFMNVYLATGYEKGDIDKPAWIKEVYSKSPECVG